MNKKQKKFYLEHKGLRCPFCMDKKVGKAIAVDTLQIDGDDGTQEIQCDTCHKRWIDYYKLIDVKEREK